MRRSPLLLICFALNAAAFAQTTRMAILIQGQRIGTTTYNVVSDKLNGKSVRRGDSTTDINAELLGQGLQMSMKSSSYTDTAGKPVLMKFRTDSSGRTQIVTVYFSGTTASVDISDSGKKSHKNLKMPTDAPVVDDSMDTVLTSPKKVSVFYVFDPTTVSFVKNSAQMIGPAKATVFGKTYDATLIQIDDPRMNTKLYVNAKGDFVKAETIMGMEIVPEAAMALASSNTAPGTIDIASASSIALTTPLENSDKLKELKLKITGENLPALPPSDDMQSATAAGTGQWTVDMHPSQVLGQKGSTIIEARDKQPDWVKPDLHIPSDDASFKTLAKQITGGHTMTVPAAMAIRTYVYQLMQPNAGIGVLRDATEILHTKEGVCRDYAILTATLCRAAGIPAKLASGLVYFEGKFYYHAWVEAFDGTKWFGVDSTLASNTFSATHVKLAGGTVEQSYLFPVLDRVRIDVLSSK